MWECRCGSTLLSPGPALQAAIASDIEVNCSSIPPNTSVPLGTLKLPGGPLDAISERPILYNNVLLFDLINCLADRVSQISAALLVYVSGDNQSAAAGSRLPIPLVVGWLDANGNPMTDAVAPQFSVTSGGGSVTEVEKNRQGDYQTTWTLGHAGDQVVAATSPHTRFKVTFHATIQS